MITRWIDRVAEIGSGLRTADWLPWRARHRAGPLNTLLLVPIRRRELRRTAERRLRRHGADVAVIYGSRDRAGARLSKSLASVRGQDYGRGDVRILLVDYGSQPGSAAEIRRLGAEYGARVVRVDGVDEWNRAHCLNIGIRRCTATFVMILDVDILLPPEYVSTCVRTLVDAPVHVLYSRVWDLTPEDTASLDEKAPRIDDEVFQRLRGRARPRLDGRLGFGLPFTFTAYLRRIRGFDERYRLWGAEDDDLAQRLDWLGLRRGEGSPTGCLHQYHEKYEGVSAHPRFEKIVAENRRLWRETHSILRNDGGWGAIPTA